jgi:UDP-N-acetylglucosamine--N-acetylmuramyl-(pentapeptide) pyrophosphoryl-undecaprenol N-acetylglucosamine transferase
MRIAFAGGGTGGHLFPGLSLAEELHRRDPAGHMLFLCTDRDRAYTGLVEPWLDVAVLPGSHRGALPRRLAGLVPAARGALRQFLRFRPDLVVGLGGYGSLAPVLCARVLGIPTLLLEQNVVPGRANRLLARLADEVACQWEESSGYFARRGRVSITGNPIRTRIRRAGKAESAAALGLEVSTPTLLVMGGSQGARPLNHRMVDALPHFAEAGRPIQFVHLAGRADCEQVAAAYAEHGLRAAVRGFLDDMSLAYGACDLALSRAGGTSIAELTALGLPALLVPLPHAADDHQRLNAQVLEYRGAALVLEQDELTAPGLARQVLSLLDDPARLAHMAARSLAVGVPRAASVVADRVQALLSGRNGGHVLRSRGGDMGRA